MYRNRLTSIFLSLSFCSSSAFAYKSTYDIIQWEPRANDTYYCIDITDQNWNIYPGYQAITCGEHLYSFSPRLYVQDSLKMNSDELRGVTFWWRVWSPSGYGDTGFEGLVTVGSDCGLPYRSDSEMVQWGCRFQDTFYCLDLFDAEWQLIKAPLVCGEHMYSFSPHRLKEMNLPAGIYKWKVWSHNAYDYSGHQAFFEGQFQYDPSDGNSSGSANWEHEGEGGSTDWTNDDGNGSASWEHEGESGSADWTDNDGNGSANWEHEGESGSVDWTDNDGNGSASWEHEGESGSVDWTDNDGNGSANWEHEGESGSADWTDNDGNGSANWEHEGESGSVEWTDNDGNGSANWEHEGESGSADWTNDNCNGSVSWDYGNGGGSVSWTNDNCDKSKK